MDNGGHVIQVPDFVVRQVGLLQLQLAAANEEIQRLTAEIAALQAAPGFTPRPDPQERSARSAEVV
jgi:hypothetical protein